METRLQNFLTTNKIDTKLHSHPPVYTCEEAKLYCADIPGIASKSLLLKEEKTTRFYMVLIPDHKKLDFKKIQNILKTEKKMTFAKPEEMAELIKLTPGSVSPFGLIHDFKNKILLCIDEEIWKSSVVQFHPNENTATLELSGEMFKKCVEAFGNKYMIFSL